MSFLCPSQSYRWLKMVLVPFLVFNLILNVGVVSTLEASPSFSASLPISFKDLSLPGMIQGKNYQSNSKNNIFLIRDLHCQPEAQEKIAQSILALNQKGIDQVFVEGAEGPLRTLLYQSFPDSNIRKNVAKKFLNEGYLTGAEFAVISEGPESKIDLMGVENSEIYLENFKAFRQTRLLYQKLKDEIENFNQWLESIKKKSYSKKLLLLDQAQKGMSSNKFSLEKIIALLEKADLDKLLKTNELWQLNTLQKEIDSAKVQKEYNELLQSFQNRLSREELQNVVRSSLEYRLGKLSTVKHFSFLKNIFEEKISKNSFKRQYPTLEIWIDFLQQQGKIDFDKAHLNLSQLIDEQIKKQADQEKVENIVKINEQWHLLQKWINLELSRKELVETVEKSPQELFRQLGFMLTSLKSPSFSKDWDLLIQEAQHFYELAQKRDQILLENALKNMNKAAQRTIILITGGFHTEGIQKLLEAKGISYTTWTPQVNGDISSDLYERIMMDEAYDLENVEFSEKRLVGHSSSEIQKMLQNPAPTGNIWAQIGEPKRPVLENMMADDLREGLAQGRSPRQIFEGWLSRIWDGLDEQEHTSLRTLLSQFVNFPEANASNPTQAKIWLDMMNKAFGEDSVLTQIVREYFESLEGQKKDELASVVVPLVVMSDLTRALIRDLESAAAEDEKLKDIVQTISDFLETFKNDKWLRIPRGKEVFIGLVKSGVITEKNLAEFLNWMDRIAQLRPASSSAVIEMLQFISVTFDSYPEQMQNSLLETLEKIADRSWTNNWKTKRVFSLLVARGIVAQVLYSRTLNLDLIVEVIDQIDANHDSFKDKRFEVLGSLPEDINPGNKDWFLHVVEVISREPWISGPLALDAFSSLLESGAKTEENLENSRNWFQGLSKPVSRKTMNRYRVINRLVTQGALTAENIPKMRELLKDVIDQEWLGSLWGPQFFAVLFSKGVLQKEEDIQILSRVMNRFDLKGKDAPLVYQGLEALLLGDIIRLENEKEIQSISQENLVDIGLLVMSDSFGYQDFARVEGIQDKTWTSVSQNPFLHLRIAYLKEEEVSDAYSLKDRVRALLLNHANAIVSYSSDLIQELADQTTNPYLLPGMISLRSKLRLKENEGRYAFSDLLKDLKVDESYKIEVLALMEEIGYRVDDKGFIITTIQLVTTIYRGSLEVDSQEAKYVTHAVTTALCHYGRKGGEAAATKGDEEVVAIGNKALHEVDYVLMNYEGRNDKKVDRGVSVAFSYENAIPQYTRKQIYLLEERSVLGLLADIQRRQEIERKEEEKLFELLNQVVKGRADESELENIITSIQASIEELRKVETNYYFQALHGYLDRDFFEGVKREYKQGEANEELIVQLTKEAQDRQLSRLLATRDDIKTPRYKQHLEQLDNRNKIWKERRLTLWGYLQFKNDMRKGTYEENKTIKIAHFSAEVNEGLAAPTEAEDAETYQALDGKNVTFTVTNGDIKFDESPELKRLEKAMGVGTDMSRDEFYAELGKIIRSRHRLQGIELTAGPFTLHFGSDRTQKEYRTLFGNHKTDGQYYINILAFLNIKDKTHRRASFLTGMSHETVHEFLKKSPIGEQPDEEILEKELAEEDARILQREIKQLNPFLFDLYGVIKPGALMKEVQYRKLEAKEARVDVLRQLRQLDDQSPTAFEPIEWITDTSAYGQVKFFLTDNKQKKTVILSTGIAKTGRAQVRRFYDEELKEWIYETRRVEGKAEEIVRQSRLVKEEGQNHWHFERFDRNKEKIIQQLKTQDARNKDVFKSLELTVDTDSKGLISFTWTDKEQQKTVNLSTGIAKEGRVQVRRFYDEELKEWIYETRRVEGDGEKQEEIVRQSRLVKEEGQGYWQFEVFDRYREKVIQQLKTQDAQNEDTFEPLEWTVETNSAGLVGFFWTDNEQRNEVYLSTGTGKKGQVQVRRFYDRDLKEWVYETQRVEGKGENKQEIIRQSRLVKEEGKNFWKFEIFDRYKEKVIQQLKAQDAKNKDAFEVMEWTVDTDSAGLVGFFWRDNAHIEKVRLSTGVNKKGQVKVRRFYDEDLKEWVYETRRVEGKGENQKEIVKQSRLVKEEGKNFWKLEMFDRNKEKVIQHLKAQDAQNKDKFEPLQWETESDNYGQINFSLIDNGQKKRARLATGTMKKGRVQASRFYDEDLKEWVYETRRVEGKGENQKEIVKQSRLVKEEGKNFWKLEIFDRNKEKVIQQLKAQDVQNKDGFEPLEWKTEVYSGGRVHFSWTDDGKHKKAILSTGIGKPGKVKVRRFYDETLEEWIYETQREVEGRMITRLSRLIKSPIHGHWMLRVMKAQGYSSPGLVEQALEDRVRRGLTNDSWALLNGKEPNESLLEAARRFGIALPEISILDEEYNREAKVTSLKLPGEVGHSSQSKELKNVLGELKEMVEGKEKELGNNVALRAIQIERLRAIGGKAQVRNGLSRATRELLGLEKPETINKEEISEEKSKIQIQDERVAQDPFQSNAVRMALHPRTKVALIQGGAGSGKTATVVEIAQQLVKQGKRVLVVSRTNLAVDNVLERLDRNKVPILRAYSRGEEGRGDDRVIESLRKYQVWNQAREDGYNGEGMKEFKKRKTNGKGYVVGVTTDSMYRVPETADQEYDVVIIDEAGTVNEIDTVLAGAKAKEKIILAGDHLQLEPFIDEAAMKGQTDIYRAMIQESGMARRWNKGQAQTFLARNYRSHPVISVMIGRLIYNKMMVPKTWRMMEEDTVRRVDVPMKKASGNEEARGTSYQNTEEANKCLEEYKRALASGYRSEQISILSAYQSQVELIREKIRDYLIRERKMKKDEAQAIVESQIGTVDSYQGRENAVVIYSFVRSNPDPSKVGFVANINRLNVALSRASDRLILVGDMKTLRNAKHTEQDRSFAILFKEKLEAEGLEAFDRFWTEQVVQGYYTLREAIQKKNKSLEREIGQGTKLTLDAEKIKKIEEYLIMKDRSKEKAMGEEDYHLLEELHERVLRGQRRIDLTEGDYEYYLRDLNELSNTFPELLSYDEEKGTLQIHWLKDESGQSVELELNQIELKEEKGTEATPLSTMNSLEVLKGEIRTFLASYRQASNSFDFAGAIAEGARRADAILDGSVRDQFLKELTHQLAEILKSKLDSAQASVEALDRALEAYQPLSDTAISLKKSVLKAVSGLPRSVPHVLRSPAEIEVAA